MIFNKKLFNKNATSVSKYWLEAMDSKLPTIVNETKTMCLQANKKPINQWKNGDSSFGYSKDVLCMGLSLIQFEQPVDCLNFYVDASIVMAEKMYKHQNKFHKDDNTKSSNILFCSDKYLDAYVTLACANTLFHPRIPSKTLLSKGAREYNELLCKIKGKLEFTEREVSILGSVASLLAGDYELSLEFLDRCKGFKEMKKHREILICVTNELLNNSNNLGIISNPDVEKKFFELFNGYRMPTYILTLDYLKEPGVMPNPLGNYIFSWLYLKIFKGKTESSWVELRHIMMS